MLQELTNDVVDGLAFGALFCGFQILTGLFMFKTYRSQTGKKKGEGKEASGLLFHPQEHWSKTVMVLAVLQYLIVSFCTVAVVPLIFDFATGWLVLVWIALIVFFSMLGMMTAVMFPQIVWRAALHVAMPFIYALGITLVLGDELSLSFWSQLLLTGIYFGTTLPIMLAVLFIQVGRKAVSGSVGMLVINLLIIGVLGYIPVRLWISVAPGVAGDSVLLWIALVVTTLATLAQYVAAWHKHVRPLVEAGKV